MGDKSAISWTDATWNPTTGCDRVSPGCAHCYALDYAGRLKGMGQAGYQTDGHPRTSGPGFGLTLHPERLDIPLRWKRPRLIFVDSMSDLFHEQVPYEFIGRVFGVMSRARQHTFQVLTKRPDRMRAFIEGVGYCEHGWLTHNRDNPRGFLTTFPDADGECRGHGTGEVIEDGRVLGRTGDRSADGRPISAMIGEPRWPLPNVWLGTSVENQTWADRRIPELLATPAAVRFLSCEPLLGPVDLGAGLRVSWQCSGCGRYHAGRLRETCPDCGRVGYWTGSHAFNRPGSQTGPGIDWVVAGGESGPDHRPMDPAWARFLHDQCAAADVPFFFKQWGGARAGGEALLDGRQHHAMPPVGS